MVVAIPTFASHSPDLGSRERRYIPGYYSGFVQIFRVPIHLLPLVFKTRCCFLQSTALPLLIRAPNGKHAAGMGRDNYLPNPGATSPAQVDMFVFLGKLMGHSIRYGATFMLQNANGKPLHEWHTFVRPPRCHSRARAVLRAPPAEMIACYESPRASAVLHVIRKHDLLPRL